MSTQQTPGPWEAALHTGASDANYFVVERRNPKTWGGYEIMLTAQLNPRRFGSLAAAQKAAKAANGIEGKA